MSDNQSIIDFLKQEKDEEIRKYVTKDKAASTSYERQVVLEKKQTGIDSEGKPIMEEVYREIDVPKAAPEWLLTDWATTNFSPKDSRVKMACYKLGLAISSIQVFAEEKGYNKKTKNYDIDMNPSMCRLRNLMEMLLLSEKSNNADHVNKILRQHIRQESYETISQNNSKGGGLVTPPNP